MSYKSYCNYSKRYIQLIAMCSKRFTCVTRCVRHAGFDPRADAEHCPILQNKAYF